MNEAEAILCMAASEHDANMYYAIQFLVPDPCIFFETGGQKILVLSDLEIERGKQEAAVDVIRPLSTYRERLKQQGKEWPKLVDIADCALREYQIRRVVVPGNFALQYADPLRERGYRVEYREPFFQSRSRKMPPEIEAIRQSQQANETALDYALQMLRDADIGPGNQLYSQGQALTAERMRQQLQVKFLEAGWLAQEIIISCGEQATRPHERGSGPLFAHQAIILDLFPRSLTTRYFADMTRTVVKGQAPNALKRLYDTVKAGQSLGLQHIRAGVNGNDVHRRIQDFFIHQGYETGERDGVMQGFFHGTGHGVGLEIHEPPRLGFTDETLQPGQVVTVEPGLYYAGIGGVRLEDLVVVTETGCTNLTTFPKVLELL
jgi:Xaa-Pro aminopeptidase